MILVRSFLSEMLKIRRSSVMWLCILGAIILPVVFTLRNISVGFSINEMVKPDAWMILYSKIAQPFTGFIMPIGIIMLCSLITQIEYRNNNWKQVHCTPQRYATIFLAKYAVLLVLMVLTFILLNISIYLYVVTPALLVDGQMPNLAVPWDHFLTESIKCFIVGLPVIGLQYLISLRFRSFMIPVGVGFGFFVFSLLAMSSKVGIISPYTFSFYYINGQMPDLGHSHYMLCILIFVGLSIANFILYVFKKDKT